MQREADKWATRGFFGISLNLPERFHGHHHPDWLRSAVAALGRKPWSTTV